MFKSLFSWWKEDPLLKHALEQSGSTLEKIKDMFSFSMNLLSEGIEEKKSIYEMDREINEIQLDIRKKVLEHLAINENQDITSCLILTTIIVDVERLGDYTKNIVELAHMCTSKLDHHKYFPETIKIRKKIEDLLLQTGDAFIDANEERAKEAMADLTWIGHKCDSNLELIVGDDSLSVRDAVIFGLLFRYLKRISGHTRNIASSVVNPFHKVGYKPE